MSFSVLFNSYYTILFNWFHILFVSMFVGKLKLTWILIEENTWIGWEQKHVKKQLLAFVFTQPEGHSDEPEVSNPFPSLSSSGMLSGRSAVCCPRLSSQTSLLFGALSPATVAIVVDSHHCPASLPQRIYSFSPSILSVTASETLYTAYKVTFMLCLMLEWSVHHAKTYSTCGLHWQEALSGQRKLDGDNDDESLRHWKREQRMDGWKVLMDCCKMT